jgi:diacylglycerol kinase (ATP)
MKSIRYALAGESVFRFPRRHQSHPPRTSHHAIDTPAGVGQHSQPVLTTAPQSLHGPDLLLVNPVAGAGAANDALPRVKAFAAEKGWRVDIRVASSAEDLAERARVGRLQRCRHMFVLGGDGTFQQLVNAVGTGQDVVLGILPAGGGNDLAQAFGLPLDPILAASLLLDGEVRLLDAARVRTSDGAERLYLGGGGVGLDAQAAQFATGSYRHLHGRFRYVLSAIRALIGFHPLQVRAMIESEENCELQAKALVLGVLNTPSYGGGMRLAPEAVTCDGKLNLVLVEDLTLLEIVRLLPRLLTHGELCTRRVQRRTLQRVRIETRTPSKFHGDGEIFGWTPVEIEVVPHAIRILCPRKEASTG